MSSSYQTGKNIVSGQVSVNAQGVQLQDTPLYSTDITAGDITVATVPANREWDIYGISISGYLAATTSVITVKIGGNNIFGTVLSSAIFSFRDMNLAPNYITLTAGETIIRNVSGGTNLVAGQITVFYKERVV
jgi:hypothetical protein